MKIPHHDTSRFLFHVCRIFSARKHRSRWPEMGFRGSLLLQQQGFLGVDLGKRAKTRQAKINHS
jgi:hypothetical protein